MVFFTEALTGILSPNRQVKSLFAFLFPALALFYTFSFDNVETNICGSIFLLNRCPFFHVRGVVVLGGRSCPDLGNRSTLGF